jgi:hypothetical protein
MSQEPDEEHVVFRRLIFDRTEAQPETSAVYEWESVADAEAYVTSFPLNLTKRRAVPGSVSFETVPK